MAVIIGAASTISSALFPDGGVSSISFGFNPQTTRLWQLGTWVPYDTYHTSQREMSLSIYGRKSDGSGGTVLFDVSASTDCTDAPSASITFTPGACGVVVAPFTDDFYPTSYSYSKDNMGLGSESWSFTSKPIIENYTGTIVFLRGIATGQMLVGDGMMSGADIGITIDDAASRDSSGSYVDGQSGSVQAGQPGIGDYAVQREIVVLYIGNSLSKEDGYKGQGSVTIPTTPVYL